jgi:hypothetical protein
MHQSALDIYTDKAMQTEILRTLAAMADPLSPIEAVEGSRRDGGSLREASAGSLLQARGLQLRKDKKRPRASEQPDAGYSWFSAVAAKWWLLFSVHY